MNIIITLDILMKIISKILNINLKFIYLKKQNKFNLSMINKNHMIRKILKTCLIKLGQK